MPKLALSLTLLGLPVAPLQAPADQPTTRTVTLAVDNMTCALCPLTVRKALERVDGVLRTEVDIGTRIATVALDAARTGMEALTRATADAGYPSRLKGE